MSTPVDDFVEVPLFSGYLVSSEGMLKNSRTGKQLKPINYRGYRCFMVKADDGRRKMLMRHRAVAMSHLGMPSDPALQVNHKDGKPGNDWVGNLEWATGKENVKHAIESGLSRINFVVDVTDLETNEVTRFNSIKAFCEKWNQRPGTVGLHLRNRGFYRVGKHEVRLVDDADLSRKCKILGKSLKTGEEFVFESIVDCARKLGISKHMVLWRLSFENKRLYPDLILLAKAESFSAWPVIVNPEQILKEQEREKVVLVRDTKTGQIDRYESQQVACARLGISAATLSIRLNQKASSLFMDGNKRVVQVKYESDPASWLLVDDPDKAYRNQTGKKPVRLITTEGISLPFESTVECAKYMGIGITALNWRLKERSGVKMKDGTSVSYI